MTAISLHIGEKSHLSYHFLNDSCLFTFWKQISAVCLQYNVLMNWTLAMCRITKRPACCQLLPIVLSAFKLCSVRSKTGSPLVAIRSRHLNNSRRVIHAQLTFHKVSADCLHFRKKCQLCIYISKNNSCLFKYLDSLVSWTWVTCAIVAYGALSTESIWM